MKSIFKTGCTDCSSHLVSKMTTVFGTNKTVQCVGIDMNTAPLSVTSTTHGGVSDHRDST